MSFSYHWLLRIPSQYMSFCFLQMSKTYIQQTLKKDPILCEVINPPELGEHCLQPSLYFHDPAKTYRRVPNCPRHPREKLKNPYDQKDWWCTGENAMFQPRWVNGLSRNVVLISR